MFISVHRALIREVKEKREIKQQKLVNSYFQSTEPDWEGP